MASVPPSVAVESTAVSPDDAVAHPDTAKVYEFTSADYPGAAQSLVFDSDGTTALGAFARFVVDLGIRRSAHTVPTVTHN